MTNNFISLPNVILICLIIVVSESETLANFRIYKINETFKL